MSELIEYIVIVHNIEDKQALHDEIINSGGSDCVPDREVDCCLNPTASRCTHYMMTEAEAQLLKEDPRVWEITRTAQDLGIEFVPNSSYTQTSNLWSRGYISAQGDLNWGLLRTVEGVQRFQWGSDSPQQLYDVAATITVPHAGDNVDVVIVDGHADPAHPEFAVNSDGTGGSRYNQFNWLSLSNGLWGSTNGTYIYTPYSQSQGASAALETNNAHGSHVAGTACGNTNGWARKANIYNIYPYGNDSNTFDFSTKQFINGYFFEYVRYWHQNKTVNPATGTRNPTVMNNSWETAMTVDISSITSVTYQGTVYTAPVGGFQTSGLNTFGIPTYSSTQIRFPVRYPAFEAQVQDCIDAGIIVVAAAGNSSYKIARDDQSTTDTDYNNLITYTSGGSTLTAKYNQGSFLACSNTVVVGALSSSYIDIKSGYSNTGPRIDVFAPGSYIMSSFFNTTSFGGVPDARNTNYYQGKINGTSMASPQVTGLFACLLELFPNSTQADAQAWLATHSKFDQMQDGGYNVINPLYDTGKLQGAPNRTLYAYWPPSPTATVATPSVVIRSNSEAKFTPVVGSGGLGILNFSIYPALPSGTNFNGWIEAISGNVTQAYFHVTSGNGSSLQAGDYIYGTGITDGTFLLSPTDSTKTVWIVSPGYTVNSGSSGSPLTVNNGLHINSTTGEITGRTATTQGSTTYTVTVTGTGSSTSAQFTLAVYSAAVYNRVNDVPYGSDPIQKVDIYFQPNTTPKGVILYVHGGGWNGGSKSSIGYQTTQAGYWLNDEDQASQLANKGYIVINCNYKLAVANSSSEAANWLPAGASSGHYFPEGGLDIETIIRFATTSGAGSAYSSYWASVVSAVNTYGLLLSGESAGGHLVAYAGMKYIYDYGTTPFVGIAPIVGPMDLDWITLNDATVTQNAKDIVNNLVNGNVTTLTLQGASPRYLYGTNASPGVWHTAVKNSSVKWYFMNNVNDALVVPALTDNFINTLEAELGNNRVKYVQLNEGAYSTLIAHNVTSPLSVRIETLAALAFVLTPTVAVATKLTTAGTAITPFTPITFVGGSGSKTYSISPSLPSGLNFNTSTGTISGTPGATSQTQTYTVTATDASGQTASATFTLSVQSSGGGGGGGLTGQVISHTEWNTIQSKVAAVLGNPDSSSVDLGWGQPGLVVSSQVSQQVSPAGYIYGSEYNKLSADINTCYAHISNTQVSNGTRDAHQLITYADYNTLSTQIDYVYTNRGTVAPTNLTASTWNAHSGGMSFNSVFGYHYQIDFGNNANFRKFWNAGGYINFSFNYAPSGGLPINQGWADLMGGLGTFKLSKNSFTQQGQGSLYAATLGISGGVYGGNMLVNPDPIANPGIAKSVLCNEADAHYTGSYFDMFIGLDNGDLFSAQSIIVIVGLVNTYTGAGGSPTTSSGNWGMAQTTYAPFNYSVTQSHAYNYIDGVYHYSAYYPGIEPSN